MPDCGYVSASHGVHDARWIDAIRACGHVPTIVNVDVQQGAEAISRQVSSLIDPSWPILAGPLHSVASALVSLPNRLVGLSWGWDLYGIQGTDQPWIKALDALVVDSLTTRDIAIELGVPAERIPVIPWGVDLDVFTDVGECLSLTDFGIRDDEPVIVSARAHEPIYHVADIIAGYAASQVARTDAKLVIAHDGSLSASLRELSASLGVADRVAFIGRISEPELAALLRRAAAFVSASEVDGTSVTLLQAMAVGTPCIVSDIPGNREWISPHESGLLFPCGDVRALARALDAALDAPAARAEITRQRARERANWAVNSKEIGHVLFPPED